MAKKKKPPAAPPPAPEPLPPPTDEDRMKSIVEWLDANLEMAETHKKKFLEDAGRLLWDALEWGEDTFKFAAEEKVARMLKAAIERNALSVSHPTVTPATLADYATETTISFARMGTRSTSATSNLLRQYEGRAWAHAAEMLRGVVRWS